jgi:hypothetical protein
MQFYFKENNAGLIFAYYVVSSKELEHICNYQYKQFPVRFFNKKLFYPILNKEYAQRVASEKNNFASGTTTMHVVRFLLRTKHIKKYTQSNPMILSVKESDLMHFNQQIIGFIELIDTIQLDTTNQFASN